MELKSPAFRNYGWIPAKYTKEGDNISPALSWSVPNGSVQFAIICEDPDAPKVAGQDYPFTHWLIYGMPGNTMSLPEALPRDTVLRKPLHAVQGVNSFGKSGYGGPLPPIDSGVHHYVFTLYALNAALKLDGGIDKQTLTVAMKNHIVATAKLIGTYERRSEQKIRHDNAIKGIAEERIAET